MLQKVKIIFKIGCVGEGVRMRFMRLRFYIRVQFCMDNFFHYMIPYRLRNVGHCCARTVQNAYVCVWITPTFVGLSPAILAFWNTISTSETRLYQTPGSTGLWRGVPPDNVKFNRNDRFHVNHIRLVQQCVAAIQQTRQLNEVFRPLDGSAYPRVR